MSNPTANLYSTSEARLDTVGSFTSEQIDAWKMIRVAYNDYAEACPEDITRGEQLSGFILWLKAEWGILLSSEDSMFAKDFSITDEAKYLMFSLKYKHKW